MGGVGCLIYLPTTAFAELWGVPYFKTVFHFSPHHAAFAISALFLGFTIGAPFSGWLSDKLRRRVMPMTVGGICATILMSMLIYIPHLSFYAVDAILFLLGASYSTHVICFAVGREVSPANVPGTAIAVTNFLVMLGGVLFQPLIGILLNTHWDGQFIAGIPNYSGADYQFALSVLPVGIFIGTLLTFFLRETHCKVIGEE